MASLEEQVATLRVAATRASAELRHAYRWNQLRGAPIDPGLVSNAIKLLEVAVTSLEVQAHKGEY